MPQQEPQDQNMETKPKTPMVAGVFLERSFSIVNGKLFRNRPPLKTVARDEAMEAEEQANTKKRKR